MKKITLFALSLICALFVASCSDDFSDSYDDATILVSKKEIEYGKSGGSETFTVTVNQKNDFIAWFENTVDWADVSANGDVVTVTVKPNTTASTRVAKILVFTQNGGLQKHVDITQTATDLVFNIIPNKVQFTRFGGEKEVHVVTNDADWTVEGGADWFKIEIEKLDGIIRLTATQNKLDNERTAVITVKSGTKEKEIEVIQKGLVELILPYQNFTVFLEEVIEFEEARGHIYRFSPKTDMKHESHEFLTNSYLMPEIEINYVLGVYAGAAVKNSIPKENREEILEFHKNYSALLVENGYQKRTNTEYRISTEDKDAEITATIYGNGVSFGLYYKQTKPMPTFDKFPYGCMDWGVDKDVVDAYEASVGGTSMFFPGDDGTMPKYAPGENDPDVSYRLYFFNEWEYIDLVQVEIGIKEYSKMVYVGKDNKLRETEEFLALLEKENFKYYDRNGDGSALTYIRPSPQGEEWVTFCFINVWIKDNRVSINLVDMPAYVVASNNLEKSSTQIDKIMKRAGEASRNRARDILR